LQKLERLSDASTATCGYGSRLKAGTTLTPFDFRLPTPDKAP
jgi:hypothetical protein